MKILGYGQSCTQVTKRCQPIAMFPRWKHKQLTDRCWLCCCKVSLRPIFSSSTSRISNTVSSSSLHSHTKKQNIHVLLQTKNLYTSALLPVWLQIPHRWIQTTITSFTISNIDLLNDKWNYFTYDFQPVHYLSNCFLHKNASEHSYKMGFPTCMVCQAVWCILHRKFKTKTFIT